MFKLIKVENRIWDHEAYRKNPSLGNHFELHKFDTQEECDEYIWEACCQTAESYENFDAEEQEWHEFVEDNSDYICIDYDPTNPVHIEHPGYEDKRPEHIEWLEKEKVRKYQEYLSKLSHEIDFYDVEIDRLKTLQAKAIARRTELSLDNV